MVDNNILSFIVLAVIGLGLIYFMGRNTVGNDSVANNEGEVTHTPEVMAALAESTPAISDGCSPMAVLPPASMEGAPAATCHEQVETVASPGCDHRLMKANTNILPFPQVSNNYAPQVPVNQQFSNTAPLATGANGAGCGGRDTLTSAELMPREDGHNTWQVVNPQAQGHLTDQNFLESGHHFGINTVGQSLKNPNLQIRSDPVIPKRDIGPFLQSSFEPDTNRRFFEIGQC